MIAIIEILFHNLQTRNLIRAIFSNDKSEVYLINLNDKTETVMNKIETNIK